MSTVTFSHLYSIDNNGKVGQDAPGSPFTLQVDLNGLQPGEITSVSTSDNLSANARYVGTNAAGDVELQIASGPVFVSNTAFAPQDTAPAFTATDFVCFLRGTAIATDKGQVTVQDIRIGDLVLTASGQFRPVKWIGFGKVLATRGWRNSSTPVIVRKDAIADNVPNRDLHITKNHSLFIDGALIPAEFLINHRSIRWDDQAKEVELYHIELETHDVIIANGVAAETYRDDGNRWVFHNNESGRHLSPQEACAQVLMGGPMVDAIWQRLLNRAGSAPDLHATTDPDLHLLVDGQRQNASEQHAGRYLFRLNRGCTTARIVSRASCPSELGVSRDHRLLGVAVRSITVVKGADRRRLIQGSDPLLQDGFHSYEPAEDIRWTKGDALLPAELFAGCQGPIDILVVTAGANKYFDFGEPMAA